MLLLVGFFIFWLKYEIEKWAFLRFYKTPPAYDESIAKNAQMWLPYAALLHLLFATWMFTCPKIFGAGDTSSFSKMADAFFGKTGAGADSQELLSSASATTDSEIFDRAIFAPHLLALGVLILVWLVWERCLEIDCHVFVGAVHFRCNNVDKGSGRRDNVSYSEAKREKSLKGLPNYNLEINPVYIEKFALDVVSAHRFVRRIGKPAKDYIAMGRQNYRGRRQSLEAENLEREMEEMKEIEIVKERRKSKSTLPTTFQANPLTQKNPMHTRGAPNQQSQRGRRQSKNFSLPGGRRGRGRGRGRGRRSVRGRKFRGRS